MSLMVDSGAYSVWKSGGSVSISLDDYVSFCKRYPEVSYYVCLDVMPGKFSDPFVSHSEAEEAAEQGWKNYLRMIRELPMEKVIPVFHQGDPFRWLEKYLDHGAPYIGVSTIKRFTLRSQYNWAKKVKEIIPRDRKTHGFGLSASLMLNLGWTSVDSASWMRVAARGGIYVPRRKNGKWDFAGKPFIFTVAPKPRYKWSSSLSGGLMDPTDYGMSLPKWRYQYIALSELHRKIVDEWLNENQMSLGELEEVIVEDGYKLKQRNDGMSEYFVAPNKVLRRKTEGVMTTVVARCLLNIKFLLRHAKEFPVEKYYFAGMSHLNAYKRVEKLMTDRLLSYADLRGLQPSSELINIFNFRLELERGKGEIGHVGSESKER